MAGFVHLHNLKNPGFSRTFFIIFPGVFQGHFKYKCKQWRSQPNNLVPLCKFQLIIIIHFFRNLLGCLVYKHGNICIAGLDRQAGYSTECKCLTNKKRSRRLDFILHRYFLGLYRFERNVVPSHDMPKKCCDYI